MEKKEKAVSFSVGGPLVNLPGHPYTFAPIPMTSFSGAAGIADDLTVFGGVNTTGLLFGVFNADVGMVKGLWKPKGMIPGLTISPIGNFMIDRWDWNFRFYPQLDLNAYWDYGDTGNFFYLGTTNWFDLREQSVHGEERYNYWVPGFHTGHTFTTPRMNYTLELKYMGPGADVERMALDFLSIRSHGVWGFYFGVSRRF
ncbi:hypothetical protein RCC89_18890 [Cytophagaceae bacterium ABcell3]|nr:hypothetical protein RCC89_18890 [Cytophagaceae bacterium ABcell3]